MVLVFIILLVILHKLFFTNWEQVAYTDILRQSGKACIVIIGIFLFFWGLNYKRLSIEQMLGFEAVPLEKTQLVEELELITITLINCHQKNKNYIRDSLNQIESPQFKFEVASLLNTIAKAHDIPPRMHIISREIKPAGLLLRFSTAGVYSPFTGECNIDNGLHPLAKPAVLLHEYSHGLGFGDEGTCTFLANIAGVQARNPLIRYSVLLSYWKKLFRSLHKMDAESAKLFKSQLPKEILSDIEAIRRESLKYPDIMPVVRDWIYDSFLRAQGVHEGLKSYDAVINLQYAYRLSHPDFQRWFQRKIKKAE